MRWILSDSGARSCRVSQGQDNYRIHEYLRLIRLASVGTSPVPSLLSETIKNVGDHCCRILLREEGRKNYRDELLERGRDLDRCRDRGYLYVRAVNSEQVPSDRIERIIGSIITRTWLRELRLILSRRTILRGTELKTEECACNARLASDKYINSQQRVSKFSRCILPAIIEIDLFSPRRPRY